MTAAELARRGLPLLAGVLIVACASPAASQQSPGALGVGWGGLVGRGRQATRILLLVLVCGCGPQITADRVQQLEREFAAITPPEQAVETGHHVDSKTDRAVVGSTYRAGLDEPALRASYDQALRSAGWTFRSHTEIPKLVVTCYSKGDLTADLQFATDPGLGWTYALDVTVGQPCP